MQTQDEWDNSSTGLLLHPQIGSTHLLGWTTTKNNGQRPLC